VTLQPLRRFPLDAAILFSDILTVPDAMGLGLTFCEGEGPKFSRPVRTAGDIRALLEPDPNEDLRYVMDTVRLVRHELAGRVPLIGFAGSPWTLATYMVEGGSSKDFRRVKGLLFEYPDLMHELLDVTARSVGRYLNAQVAAGAQALMIFDTWGGILSHHHYEEFSLAHTRTIIEGLTREHEGRRVPVILFSKGAGQWLQLLANSGCDALGVDWTVNIGEARRQVGDRVALQGNLDPCALYASPTRIRSEVARVLADFGAGTGHAFNLGHGIHPQVDPDHVQSMVQAVHTLSPAYHT
jgi:uroporphyrinogen decarboxylase